MKTAFEFLAQKDPIFQSIINKYGLPERPSRPQGFETLVLLLLEQQVSIASAKATFLRLREHVGQFQPSILIAIAEEQYRALGVSRQKASYIKALATAIENQELQLETLPHKSAEQVRRELLKIKGIGNWTIDIYLMFCLQAPDLLPLGDIAVVRTIQELWQLEGKEQMTELAMQWSPYRSFATYLLWHYYLNKRNRTITYQY
ncbi:DNA-3-methyladenine glycosylase 2 family protein [Flavobacterium sp. K77]|uniref:DNA-3-methyladenine glycosylase family protein n=1 Tax=Flavobacterium sp. K77 TaxID=2910676 RepID=UPI001F3C24F5|nr:DNA-3-methyladenine glycosylase 2 family protein [Flavobacterium sp. K77]MCF6141697.1 DNA-3-methyladenine glycosylase 2 family protein [Flavobacterium sp. K77]